MPGTVLSTKKEQNAIKVFNFGERKKKNSGRWQVFHFVPPLVSFNPNEILS